MRGGWKKKKEKEGRRKKKIEEQKGEYGRGVGKEDK